MKGWTLSLLSLILLIRLASAQNSFESALRVKLEGQLPDESIRVADVQLEYSKDIHRFYADSNFESVWLTSSGASGKAEKLLKQIREVQFDGLRPEDYHLTAIESSPLGQSLSFAQQADLELLLTDAFFKLAKDLHQGKVNLENFKDDWEISPKIPRYSYPELLLEIKSGAEIDEVIQRLYPDFRMYENGREVIRKLTLLADQQGSGWKDLKLNGAIRPDQSHNLIPEIKKRLAFWGYEVTEEDSDSYDEVTVDALKSFQKRNGMEPDGIIGKMTIHALNQSPSDLVDIASVNMERLRWLPDTVKTGPLILVNIANYQLDFLDGRDTLLSERVIVGKRYHESPIFTAEMSYIVFSPYWNIPYSITRKEILPKAKKDPGYIAAKNMEIVDNSGNVVNPSSIDWKSKSFPYRIRQKPGETNSLGLVKFIFPNNHSVYIHDTPARYLFAREERAMSHGCIRVQNPAELAKMLLKNNPGWNDQSIQKAMTKGEEETVFLKQKIPVVLLYLTFWADATGQGHFRPDIYERDQKLLRALRD
ncbi:L,D-transpeptidase family protein [Algoriphagus namhaensis]